MIKNKLLYALIIINFVPPAISDEYTELITYRDALKAQIATVESETNRCEKSLKGWKAATIISGVGAVASGIGIIAQTQQIKENQKILNEIAEDKEKSDIVKEFMQEVKK